LVALLAPPLLGLLLRPTLHPSAPGALSFGTRRGAVLLQLETEGMPAELEAWGCDEALWSKIRGAKGSLRKLVREGDEATGRKRIASIRKLVEEEEADPDAAAARQAAAAQAKKEAALAQKEETVETAEERAEKFSNPRTASASGARSLKAGYELKGDIPEGFDGGAAEQMVMERQQAKIARDFATADELQAKLIAMGVFLDDRRRTWSVKLE